MTKKEYILAVIDALPDWEMWRGIKAMVQNNQLDDETIDKVVIIFKKVMQEITDSIRENKVIILNIMFEIKADCCLLRLDAILFPIYWFLRSWAYNPPRQVY